MKSVDNELKERSTWQDIGDVFTPEGRKKLKKGQILGFLQEGVQRRYKIMQKRTKHVWVKEVNLYTPEEVDKMADDKRNKLYEEGHE